MNAQIISTVAGNGIQGFGGDGGAATAAQMNLPYGIGINRMNDIYIADGNNNLIRKVDASSKMTTFAGNGISGFSGDGGPATLAQLYGPNDIAIDKWGNVYIADYGNYRIRKVDVAGNITTIAGNSLTGGGGGVYSGDGGPASAAGIHHLGGIAIDTANNIYLGDDSRIRKIDATGTITTIAGTGTLGYGGDGGAATAALLYGVYYVRTDTFGNIYFTDGLNYRVRKIDALGIITTIAGNGSPGFSGDGGLATAATLNRPQGLAVNSKGDVYFSDIFGQRIRRVDGTGIIVTIAGDGTKGFSGDDDVCATAASKMNIPLGMAIDSYDNIYVADEQNQRVRKISINVPPSFVNGSKIYVGGCKDATAIPIDTQLAIKDAEAGQGEVWSMLAAPMHGTAATAYTATATGGTLTPSGLSYTPAAGYIGTDSFIVSIKDCMDSSSTAKVYVTIDTVPVVSNITGIDTVCWGATILLSDATTGGVWSVATGKAIVAAGVVTGHAPGVDTIKYTVTNACASVAAAFPFEVIHCNVASPQPSPSERGLSLYPNPVGDVIHVDGLHGTARYRLLDMVGRVINMGTLDNVSNKVNVGNVAS